MTKLSELIPDAHNANKGTARGAAQLEISLRKYGAGRSILVDRNGRIIAGNKTAENAAAIGLDDVVVVETDGTKLVAVKRTDLDLTDDSTGARELAYADNRVAEVGLRWDAEAVFADFEAGIELGDFFKDDELADLLGDLMPTDEGKDTEPQIDRAEELRQKWGVESGQLWQLGEHRLICGDCTDADVVARLMGGEKADMVNIDPPYGVDYHGGSGSMYFNGARQAERKRIQNDASPDAAFQQLYDALKLFPSKVAFIWCAPQFYREALTTVEKVGWKLFAAIVWNKTGGGFMTLGATYKPKYEMALACKIDKIPFYGASNETTVWDMDKLTHNKNHPTEKPVPLFERAIRNHTKRDEMVADFFSGSGTTIIACENLGRKCRAVEIDAGYVAVALERWAEHTGKTPELIG